jgi:malonyl-CoA O-methyltransferase
MSALSVRESYRLWAPGYETETPISYLEDQLVAALEVPVVGRRLLDVGCGTGRRLRSSGAALAVGVDLTPEMLACGTGSGSLAVADLRALPFAMDSFDVVWCRLVIGHIDGLVQPYAALSYVCRPGGMVVVTDFHPDAVAAGHRRTFRDATGEVQEIEHHVHDPQAHATAATAHGLRLVARRDGEVGPDVRPFYTRANRLAEYEQQQGLRIVLALAFRRLPR